MKKILLIFLTIAFIVSCGTLQQSNTIINPLQGSWTLNAISYSDPSDSLDVTFFNDTTKLCLEDSIWTFVTSNNSGRYAVIDTSCNTGERNFKWAIQLVDTKYKYYDFLIQPSFINNENNTDNSGYRFSISHLTETVMVLEQTLQIQGKTILIQFNFNKA